MPVEC